MVGGPWMGRRLRRLEDGRFLKGQACYVADVHVPGAAHVGFVRSPHAHAEIVRVEAARAARHPACLKIVTFEDLPSTLRLSLAPPSGLAGIRVKAFDLPPPPPLADGRVRHVGEAVAAVVASDPYALADIMASVDVTYRVLPASGDLDAALAPDAPLVHGGTGNVIMRASCEGGDWTGPGRDETHRVEVHLEVPRLCAVPLEPRGAMARSGDDGLTVWTSSQNPHRVRGILARALDLPPDRVRVISPDVGGAFGSKATLFPEDLLVAWLAIGLGRPVGWTEQRRENFTAGYHGRGQLGHLEADVTPDGEVRALRATIQADLGAYAYEFSGLVPLVTASLLAGPYRIRRIAIEILGVTTHRPPTGPLRGAGRPEAAFYLERLMDTIARRLGLDPVDVRRRNLIPPDALPYTTPTGWTYDAGDYPKGLHEALRLAEYQTVRSAQASGISHGWRTGVGIACFIERCGGNVLWEEGSVSIAPDGHVVAATGSHSHGQGHETAFAQVVADVLDVDPAGVEVVHGDTARVARGVGTFASRSGGLGASAVWNAAGRLRARARGLAAQKLEANEDDVVLADGRFFVRGAPGRGVTLKELARAAVEPLVEESRVEAPAPTFPCGVHVAVVEVDPTTGEVRLVRYVAVDDAGTVINPLIVEGQVWGSIGTGVEAALSGAMLYDAGGQPLTATLMDYPALRSTQAPRDVRMSHLHTPTDRNPLGVRGVGEVGTIGAPAAILNAIADALAPLGVQDIPLPATPSRLWAAIERSAPGASMAAGPGGRGARARGAGKEAHAHGR